MFLDRVVMHYHIATLNKHRGGRGQSDPLGQSPSSETQLSMYYAHGRPTNRQFMT